jgi:hypothetical protein
VATRDPAALAAALTQANISAGDQAVATAEIVRLNAGGTLDSANATLSAAQTQDENNANVIAAQIAATAVIVRAHALATLNSAGSTQSAALTQDAIRQTQVADLATAREEAAVSQQNKDELAAGTQTAVANTIATQTQAAVATSQWYVDQSRQRKEERQGPISFLWMWCLPIFVVLFAALCLWGVWRWLKSPRNREGNAAGPMEALQGPPGPGDSQIRSLQTGINPAAGGFRLTRPDDQIRGWLDEIKRKLIDHERNSDDYPDG